MALMLIGLMCFDSLSNIKVVAKEIWDNLCTIFGFLVPLWPGIKAKLVSDYGTEQSLLAYQVWKTAVHKRWNTNHGWTNAHYKTEPWFRNVHTDQTSKRRDLTATFVVCWLLNVPATCLCISWKDLIKQVYTLSISPSHSTLTPDRPVTALTLQRQAPIRVAIEVPINFLKSAVTRKKIHGANGNRTQVFRSRGERLYL